MPELLQWLAAAVPAIAIIGFWMTLSSRLTKAETVAEAAQRHSSVAIERLAVMNQSYTDFREKVATEYIHRQTMIDVEDRLSKAIDRLSDRFDTLFSHLTEDRKP